MSRALNLKLDPQSVQAAGLGLEVFTYAYCPAIRHASMRESVYLGTCGGPLSLMLDLTPEEARTLASQLLQVADKADQHRARRQDLEDIEEQLRDPDFDATLLYFHHPDVVYASAGHLAEMAAANPGKFVIGAQEACGGSLAMAPIPIPEATDSSFAAFDAAKSTTEAA